jgi:hypothetical protein
MAGVEGKNSVSKVYKDVSCSTPALPHLGAIFTDLTFLPQRKELLAIACHRLYLLDSSTLEIKRVLLERQVVGPISVAADYSRVLVQGSSQRRISDSESALEHPDEVVVLGTATWAVEDVWKLPGKLAGLGITGDSKSGVLLIHGSDDASANCVLWIQDFPLSSSEARNFQTGYSCGPTYHRRLLFAVQKNLIIDPSPMLRVWDGSKQVLVRERQLQPGVEGEEINDSAIRVSPDGSYVTLVVNSNRFFQELLVINPVTGNVIFEGEKGSYSQALRGIGMVRTTALEGVSSDISADGRFVLSARGKRVAIFEVTK